VVFIAGSGILYGFIMLRTRTLKKQKRVLEEQVHSHTLELEQEKAKVEQINLELEQRVAERTRKLAIANEKLLHAQKMEALGTLAGGVAHDLNNILAGIVTYPDFLLTELPEDSPLISYVLAIQQSGEKAAAIVNDLLSLAKRRAKTMKVVNLNRVIADFTQSPELEKIMTKNPDVKMETHLKKELPNIMGSPVHLSKALMNLLSNAVEAMPRGGMIDITTKNQYVDPQRNTDESREVKAGEYVMVIVSDTGVGMSEQEVKRIFEPFYSKKNGGGTGLGLAVVWGTVQDHKGFITVHSRQDQGTRFILHFPITHQKLVEDKPTTAINQLMGNGESILVVDDIKQQREVASLILTKLGYVVNTAAGGEEAIEYLKEHPVDLLMLDMIMEQGISGLETYKRALRMYPDQKAILVSGYSETAEVKEALRLGAGCYVRKPYGIEKIGKAVKEELDKQ
jgi:signal transduction histidine kinase/ActR/RegA family two-component response regulator